MLSQVAKWGHSFALRIPRSVAAMLHLDEEEAQVELSVSKGRLVVTPVRAGYRLEALVAGVTEENLHGETEMGPPIGQEAW